MRNPTEQSVATLLTLSFDTHGLLLDSEKWSLMQQHKEYIKRPLGKGGKCTLHLLRLPENPEELPEELRLRAFPFGPFCAAFKAALHQLAQRGSHHMRGCITTEGRRDYMMRAKLRA